MKRPSKHKVADTMAQAAAMAGISPAMVRFAKNRGCDAFNHSRVDVPKLQKWLENNKDIIESEPTVTKEQADIKLKLKRLERETFLLEQDRKLYLNRTQVCERVQQIAQQLRAVLQAKLETELPPRLLGLNAVQIGQVMSQTVDEVCRLFNDRTSEWAIQS